MRRGWRLARSAARVSTSIRRQQRSIPSAEWLVQSGRAFSFSTFEYAVSASLIRSTSSFVSRRMIDSLPACSMARHMVLSSIHSAYSAVVVVLQRKYGVLTRQSRGDLQHNSVLGLWRTGECETAFNGEVIGIAYGDTITVPRRRLRTAREVRSACEAVRCRPGLRACCGSPPLPGVTAGSG